MDERYRALDTAFARPSAPDPLRHQGQRDAGRRPPHAGLGAGADANSAGEIEVALRAGFRPDEIVFTGVGKTPAELAWAVGLGLAAINAESSGEMARIADLAAAQGTRARVAVRINPDIDAGSHPHISTGLQRDQVRRVDRRRARR